MSSYYHIFSSIYGTAVEVWPQRRITWTFLGDFLADLKQFGRVKMKDLTIVCCIAIALTLLRGTLARFILKPFAIQMKFTSKNVVKFPESLWKFSYYLLMYIYACYLLFGTNGYPYFKSPRTCWTEWSVGVPVASDIYYLYAIQISFYIHSIYATFYMDPWRKDSIAMVVHHFLTIFLIGFSFAVRYHKVGVVVLFLHDICDVMLEGCKIFVCLKTRNNKQYYWPEYFINFGFLGFAFSWFYCRLYLYPYKVLYPCGHYAVFLYPHAPFYYFFNGMLFFLFAMNLYWFHYIILLIWRVVTGRIKKIEDTRDLEMEEGMTDKNKKIATSQEKSKNEVTKSRDPGMIIDKNDISSNGNYYKSKPEDRNGKKTNGVFMNHVRKDDQRGHDKIE